MKITCRTVDIFLFNVNAKKNTELNNKNNILNDHPYLKIY